MIYTICYTAIFLIEVLISVFYFETKFEKRVSNKYLYIVLLCTYIVLYSARLLNLSWVNLIAFFICNFFLLYRCYNTNISSCIFHTFMLLILMTITESIVMFASSTLFDVDLLACLDNSTNLIFQSTISKTLYLFTVYLISKFSTKELHNENNSISLFLFILPVTSIILMYSILYSLSKYDIEQTYLSLIVTGIVLLFISNIIVFWVYEFSLKTNKRNMELEIEQQRETATNEYYELLRKQNENTKIVIHDIKRHLSTIKSLDKENNSPISEYIDSIIDDFGIDKPINYCNNPLVNVITNRYRTICEQSNIKFNIDIRNAKIDFMKEIDITALLDNMLENALEAAIKSEDKFIDFTITTKQDLFLSITITNSVSEKITIKHNRIISSKKPSESHGIGIKSIRRVVKKHNGEFFINFNEEDMTVTANAIFII